MKLKPRIKDELKKFLIQRQKAERGKVSIISAQKLTEEEWTQIHQIFPDLKGMKVENIIDESLIAGVIIQRGSKIIDLSLKAQLSEFRKTANAVY